MCLLNIKSHLHIHFQKIYFMNTYPPIWKYDILLVIITIISNKFSHRKVYSLAGMKVSEKTQLASGCREKVRVTDMRAQHTRNDGVIKLRRHPSHIRWSDERASSNASLAIKKEIVCKLLLVWLVLSGVLCVYSSVRYFAEQQFLAQKPFKAAGEQHSPCYCVYRITSSLAPVAHRSLSSQQPTYFVNLLHFSGVPETLRAYVSKRRVVPQTVGLIG